LAFGTLIVGIRVLDLKLAAVFHLSISLEHDLARTLHTDSQATPSDMRNNFKFSAGSNALFVVKPWPS
jgi:hypothetical protein